MNEVVVVVVAAARTAIGDFGGGLKDVAPCDLGATVIREALARAGVAGPEVGHVAVGHVINTEPRDMYLSRVAAINAGIGKETPAFNVNRLCGSGLQAIVSAAQTIMLGDTEIAVGAGAESMSRAPYIAPAQRWGARMGDSAMVDMMTGALSDPFGRMHMGVTAENVAARYSISRADQDALAVESHRRAAAAIDAGRFRDQIVPVTLKTRKGETVFDTDEHVRRDITIEGMAALRPVFQKENGTVTAGNASGLNDGAGAVVLMSAAAAAQRGIAPMAR
ncbi:acetyl-CoA C-acyltransferase, partial [Bordetella pertussis]